MSCWAEYYLSPLSPANWLNELLGGNSVLPANWLNELLGGILSLSVVTSELAQ